MTSITSSHTVSRPPHKHTCLGHNAMGALGLGTVRNTAKAPEGEKIKAQRPPGWGCCSRRALIAQTSSA